MARILICVSNAIWHEGEYKLPCFYEQFLDALKAHGNEVLVFIPHEFNLYAFMSQNTLQKDIDEEQLRQDIITFNPELIISFNHAVYNKLLNITNCPFIIWNADLCDRWNQLDVIKENVDRFTFFCFGKPSIKNIKAYFPNVLPSQIHVAEPATSIKPENIAQDKNISFIGTKFSVNPHHGNSILALSKAEKRIFLEALIEKKKSHYDKDYIPSPNASRLNEFTSQMLNKGLYIESYMAAEKRVSEVFALSDLGLTLYGQGWNELVNVYPSLAAAFDDRIVYTAKHNQDIYNSSKICLNSMHPQCADDTSWRVPDIMASNGCILSEYSISVKNIFGDYKIPMYSNSYEARQLCMKLLQEENLRHDIVAKSHEIVAQRFTWDVRLAEIQEIMGLKLLHNLNGSIKILRPKYVGLRAIRQSQAVKNVKSSKYYTLLKRIVKKVIFYHKLYPILYKIKNALK